MLNEVEEVLEITAKYPKKGGNGIMLVRVKCTQTCVVAVCMLHFC